MKVGTIVHWDGIDGYGFVRPDEGGEHAFFLEDHVRYDSPAVGDRVRYKPHQGDRGPRAKAVELIG